MRCPNRLTHTIRRGDNLYQLALHYQTSVPDILALNPQINPYNLQTGSTIIICPGDRFVMQPSPWQPSYPDSNTQIELVNDMRLVWLQHIYWTRMLLISIAERLKDQQYVEERLLENPEDIARVFVNYYSADIANMITMLITEHLQIGGALITALRDGDTEEADNLTRLWYRNADQMADAFSSINPFYDREMIREMLYSHLDLTAQEVAMRLAGNYPADIAAFEKVETEVLAMADYFSQGILKQFPQ